MTFKSKKPKIKLLKPKAAKAPKAPAPMKPLKDKYPGQKSRKPVKLI